MKSKRMNELGLKIYIIRRGGARHLVTGFKLPYVALIAPASKKSSDHHIFTGEWKVRRPCRTLANFSWACFESILYLRLINAGSEGKVILRKETNSADCVTSRTPGKKHEQQDTGTNLLRSFIVGF